MIGRHYTPYSYGSGGGYTTTNILPQASHLSPVNYASSLFDSHVSRSPYRSPVTSANVKMRQPSPSRPAYVPMTLSAVSSTYHSPLYPLLARPPVRNTANIDIVANPTLASNYQRKPIQRDFTVGTLRRGRQVIRLQTSRLPPIDSAANEEPGESQPLSPIRLADPSPIRTRPRRSDEVDPAPSSGPRQSRSPQQRAYGRNPRPKKTPGEKLKEKFMLPAIVEKRDPSPMRPSLARAVSKDPSPVRSHADRSGQIAAVVPISVPVSRTDPSPVRRTDPLPVRRNDPSPVRRTDPLPVRRNDPSPVGTRDPPTEPTSSKPPPVPGAPVFDRRELIYTPAVPKVKKTPGEKLKEKFMLPPVVVQKRDPSPVSRTRETTTPIPPTPPTPPTRPVGSKVTATKPIVQPLAPSERTKPPVAPPRLPPETKTRTGLENETKSQAALESGPRPRSNAEPLKGKGAAEKLKEKFQVPVVAPKRDPSPIDRIRKLILTPETQVQTLPQLKPQTSLERVKLPAESPLSPEAKAQATPNAKPLERNVPIKAKTPGEKLKEKFLLPNPPALPSVEMSVEKGSSAATSASQPSISPLTILD